MKSMTGYGRGSAHDDRLEVTIEINSVNRKSLDIYTSLPRDWQAMEKSIADVSRTYLKRGKVNVAVQVKELNNTAGLSWDDEVVGSTIKGLKELSDKQGVPFEPDANFLLRVITLVGGSNDLPSWEDSWPTVEKALKEALEQISVMRKEEGAALYKDIEMRLKQLQSWEAEIIEQSKDTVPNYRELLFQRLQKANLELDLDDERVLKEISLFADRCDIAEELTRLDSHFEQFFKTIKEEAAVGRKLDFLCQEINREVNTVGSKANNIEITRRVIDCKNELERIREQVQNIE